MKNLLAAIFVALLMVGCGGWDNGRTANTSKKKRHLPQTVVQTVLSWTRPST